MKKLAIVILNYNGYTHTLECLKSLTKLKWPGTLQIIVVDNASGDDSVARIEQKFPHFTLIKNQHNLGFAEGNNVGVRKALLTGSDLVMLLNNDTTVDPKLAQELSFDLHKGADITVPKIYFSPGQEFHYSRYKSQERGKVIWYAGGHIDWGNIMGIHHGVDEVDHGQYDQEDNVEFATGCCMMIRKAVIDKIGLFDSKYFLYLEDADFSVRAKRAGFAIRYMPKAIVWHKNAESTGGSGSSLQDYYFTRNRLLFGFRYAPWRTKFALFRESLRLLFTGTRWQKRGALDLYLCRFGHGSYK